MRRHFVIPTVAATAFAQQLPSGEAEKALLSQVHQYYQLMMEKKFREAEKLVAEDSKEDYYNGKKPDIRGFTVLKTEITDDSHAVVTIKAKQLILMMGGGAQIFEIPSPTSWKLENGEWRWYIPDSVKNRTPFGKLNADSRVDASAFDMKGQAPGTLDAPNFAALQGQLRVEKTAITFTKGSEEQTVAIQNGLPGPVDFALDGHVEMIRGLTVTIDKLQINAGEKAVVRLKRMGDAKFSDEVVIRASPLNTLVRIQVEAK